MFLFLIIQFLLLLTNENVIIIGPKDLASSLNSTLELEYANFGNLPTNFISRGEIIIDSGNYSNEGCESFPENFIYENPNFKSDFPIILLRRGSSKCCLI